MPTLKNNRHEKFSLAIFKGKTQKAAAIQAGYINIGTAIDVHASRLIRNAKIIDRIQELHAQVATTAIMTVKERKERLTTIARGNVIDYQTTDGIHIDGSSPNTGAIEGLETREGYSRDSQAGNITIKRPVVPEALRNEIFLRDGNQCVLCTSTHNLQLDHIMSLSKGGRTEDSNLQTLCEECNKRKGAGKNSQSFTITKLKLHNPMAAIAELNKMEGEYAPAKIEVEPGENLAEALKDLLSGLRGYEKTG